MIEIIDKMIYLYLFGCILLLLFNIFYIFSDDFTKKRINRREEYWKRELPAIVNAVNAEEKALDKHKAYLVKRLKKLEELMAFEQALKDDGLMEPIEKERYLKMIRPAFTYLAVVYQKKDTQQRAFFAYIVSVYYKNVRIHGQIIEILLGYLPNSSVYCREQVLKALYVIGNENAVEQAFEYISQNGWFHHRKLIADGLCDYTGDKEQLVYRLWKHCREWEEELMVGIVQFAGNVSECFSEEFAAALADKTIRKEIHLEILRYFRKFTCEKVYEKLLWILENPQEQEVEYGIVVASILDRYPGERTVEALKKALHSENWYVRKNAAISLGKIGMKEDDVREIRESGDRYALEMLTYIMEREEWK